MRSSARFTLRTPLQRWPAGVNRPGGSFCETVSGRRRVRGFPFRHARRDLGVVLGQLPELAEHVLLRRTRRLGDERRRAEELPRRIASPFHLQDPSHLPIVGDRERDEHDHPSGQDAAEMWTHGVKAEGLTGESQRPDRLRRGMGAVTFPDVKILVIDIGGSHIKLLATGRRVPVKVPSGPTLTAARMVEEVLEATEGWSYDAVSIGYPGPVANNRPKIEPVNLGDGWVKFNYQRAFGVPVRMINDAAMQALGSYAGRTMLFLGLDTGLGNTLVMEGGCIVPMEMGHLPFANGKTYEDTIGEAGLKKSGKRKWRRNVRIIVDLLAAATNADYVVLGGGNVRHLNELPPNTRRGSNANAFRGGFRLWDDVAPKKKRAK